MILLRHNSLQKSPEDARNTGIFRALIGVAFTLFFNALPISISISVAADIPAPAHVSVTTADSPLGTLFLTAEERAALEAARLRRNQPAPLPSIKTPPSATLTATPKDATITGLMRRSDGATAVWINGELQPNFSRANAQRLSPADVGMVQGTVPTTKPDEPQTTRGKIGAAGISNVTANNQTKPLKRRAPVINQITPPKIPGLDNRNLLLQPKPLKNRKKTIRKAL